jgi:hypothetical protein
MILKKLPKNAIVPKFHGRCDGWISIYDLVIEADNNKIYNYNNAQRYAEQMEGDEGLKNPISIWKNSTIISSGATRKKAGEINGYTHMPVTEELAERPSSRLDRINLLRQGNESREIKFGDNFRGLTLAIEAWREENGNKIPETSQMTKFFKSWKVASGDYNTMMDLKDKHPDLYDKVINDKMGVRDAKNSITKATKVVMRRHRKIDKNLFNPTDIKHMLLSVKKSIDGVKSSIFGTDGHQKDFPTLHSADTNLYSGIAHASLCAAFAYMINKMDNYANDWTQTTKHDRFHDVYSISDDTGIEVKTHICEMGKTPSWEPNNFKPGYHLLLAMSENLDSAFLAFCKLDLDDTKKMKNGRVKILNDKLLEKQKTGDCWSWYGNLKNKDGKAFFQQQLTNFTNE